MADHRKKLALVTALIFVPVAALGYSVSHLHVNTAVGSKKTASIQGNKKGSASTSAGSSSAQSHVGGSTANGPKGSTGSGGQTVAAQRLDRDKTRIADAVKQHRLTQQQADQILAEIDQLSKSVQTTGTTTDQAKSLNSARMNLRKWASDNHIPPQYVTSVF